MENKNKIAYYFSIITKNGHNNILYDQIIVRGTCFYICNKEYKTKS